MKYLTYFFILLTLISCSTSSKQENTPTNTPDTLSTTNSSPGNHSNPPPSTETYQNKAYQVALEHPSSWEMVEDTFGNELPIINGLPKTPVTPVDRPLTVHAPAELSYVGLYPQGFGTELPSGRQQSVAAYEGTLPVPFPVDLQNSVVFQLEDGTPWGYYLTFDTPPAGWSDDSFIFAQIATDSVSIRCYDETSGEEIPMEQCDPLEGDRIARNGTIDPVARQEVLRLLSSLHFPDTTSRPLTDLIRVEQPEPNQAITSPFTIRGEARGPWYFEASFPVRLVDQRYRTLVDTFAQARAPWMTSDFVPFEMTLSFPPPEDEWGYLIFEKGNASGMPEHSRWYQLPVLFNNKE